MYYKPIITTSFQMAESLPACLPACRSAVQHQAFTKASKDPSSNRQQMLFVIKIFSLNNSHPKLIKSIIHHHQELGSKNESYMIIILRDLNPPEEVTDPATNKLISYSNQPSSLPSRLQRALITLYCNF